MTQTLLQLTFLKRYQHVSNLLLRLGVGSFLVWGVWDNIASAARMQEFVGFLENFGFIYPEFMAYLTVWVQFFIGCAFMTGLCVRWAGALCVLNFLVAIVMVDSVSGVRASFPSLCLILISLHLMTSGAGKMSLDAVLCENKARKN